MIDENQAIWDAIAAPLDPAEIKIRKAGDRDVPYIDKTSVEMRLNAVCPGGWHFQVTPITIPSDGSRGQWVVKGTLTILGVTREDFGMNDNEQNFDPPKAAVSDALKRCAALFGFGRELAEDPRGSIAKAKDTQTGKSGNGGKPTTVQPPQKPAQPAKGPSGVRPFSPEALRDYVQGRVFDLYADDEANRMAIEDAAAQSLAQTWREKLNGSKAAPDKARYAIARYLFGLSEDTFKGIDSATRAVIEAWITVDTPMARIEAESVAQALGVTGQPKKVA